MIGVLDYGMGNLRSVCNAVYEIGQDWVLRDNGEEFDDLSHLIIPGVGHFATAMRQLRERELEAPIRAFAASGRPVLGVCLGMQILAGHGAEGGGQAGLGLIPATVEPLPKIPGQRIPHMGWNTVSFRQEHPLTRGAKDGRDYYFVHSYAMVCDEMRNVIGITDYGADFVSFAANDNVAGFQFHPEKSQINGLQLLENFCNWDGRC
jgi:imidazole glycerol-phosphate synthase subunit HisH